jgi:Tfp pilus assembly protein PilO
MSKEEPRRRATDGQWHLDKNISVGHMISTLAFIVTGFAYVSAIDTKVEKQEVEIQALKNNMSNERADTRRVLDQLRDDMKGISVKVDKLINRALISHSKK